MPEIKRALPVAAMWSARRLSLARRSGRAGNCSHALSAAASRGQKGPEKGGFAADRGPVIAPVPFDAKRAAWGISMTSARSVPG